MRSCSSSTGRARGTPSPRPGRGASACRGRTLRRRSTRPGPTRGPGRPTGRRARRRAARPRPRARGGAGPRGAARRGGRRPGLGVRCQGSRATARHRGAHPDVVGSSPSLPPVHAAPGSGVCAPWRYSVMNSSSRGSSTPVSCSCTPQALATTGAGRSSTRREHHVGVGDGVRERLDLGRRQVGAVGHPHGTVLEGVHGELVGHGLGVDAAVEPGRVVVATDGRGLLVGDRLGRVLPGDRELFDGIQARTVRDVAPHREADDPAMSRITVATDVMRTRRVRRSLACWAFFSSSSLARPARAPPWTLVVLLTLVLLRCGNGGRCRARRAAAGAGPAPVPASGGRSGFPRRATIVTHGAPAVAPGPVATGRSPSGHGHGYQGSGRHDLLNDEDPEPSVMQEVVAHGADPMPGVWSGSPRSCRGTCGTSTDGPVEHVHVRCVARHRFVHAGRDARRGVPASTRRRAPARAPRARPAVPRPTGGPEREPAPPTRVRQPDDPGAVTAHHHQNADNPHYVNSARG